MMKHLKAIVILFILHVLPGVGISQSPGCIDSVSFTKFYPTFFNTDKYNYSVYDYSPQRDEADNIYLSGTTTQGPFFSYWSIAKFNFNNRLVWYKNYKTDVFNPFSGNPLSGIDENANLLYSSLVGNPTGGQFSYFLKISKTDSSGNLKWNKIIKHGANPNLDGALNPPKMGNNGELFCIGSYADDNYTTVVKLDSLANIIWARKYSHNTVNKYHSISSDIVVQNESNLIMVIPFFYDADVVTDPAVKFGVQLVKLGRANGSVLQQHSFMIYNDASATIPNRASLFKINYDTSANRLLLIFKEDGFGTRSPKLILLDSNLNITRSTAFVSGNLGSGLENLNISKNNTTTFSYPVPAAILFRKDFAYMAVNSNLDIIVQRKIYLTNLGFPSQDFIPSIAFKKNGILNFQLATYSATPVAQSLYLYDNSPFYNGISPCLGIDTAIYNTIPIYTKPVTNPFIEEAGTTPLSISNQPPPAYPVEDFTIPRTEICKEISICDTIKLTGTKYHCLSNPIDSFKIYRNPLCKRKTNWQVDTAAIKILSQNDTALHVQYLQPYRGSIRVGFGGCSLTDSIAIEVYNAKTGINLGNDTLHCPGKSITLKAGTGFKTYQWQDGSTKDSLVATQPGLYHVRAADSCGNIFKDSLTINPFDVVLQANFTGVLCTNLKDTALFTLPNQLYNYIWLPPTAASLNNYTWRVYPTATTTYNISGERLPGCIVSDTVLIRVKPNCLPDYIYFPTAFTPNNDGINDTYKPGINGQLTVYEFIIFNRYGQPVFKSTTPGQGWDGYFKGSKKPLGGSYVWSCKYQFAGKLLLQEQGSFILIR